MINLIPNKEKKEMIKGFYYRLTVMFLAILGVSFLVAFIAILPSFIISSIKNKIVNIKLEEQKKEPIPIPDQEILDIIKNLDNKLVLVEKAEQNKFIVSEKIVNAIILRKLPGIKITNIDYEVDPVKGKKINVQGSALSRKVLLSFRQALENDVAFKNVNLPISNFVQGSNIKFYLSLIPS